MNALLKNKTTLALIGFFIVIMFVYKTFFAEVYVPGSEDISATTIGNELLSIQAELESVTLDRTVFSTPEFMGLLDFTVILDPQPVGRPNPFDTIGRN